MSRTRSIVKRLIPRPVRGRLRRLEPVMVRLASKVPGGRRRLTPFQRFSLDGHNSLLLDGLELTPDSTVLDFGGYTGEFTAALLERYSCRMFVYEPVAEFVGVLQKRFESEEAVVIRPYGLASSDEQRVFMLSADATGAHATGEGVQVRFRSLRDESRDWPTEIDLVAMNIEGGEYELIPVLVEAEAIQRVRRLRVQFHRIDERSDERREAASRLLARTHRQEWSYDYVWESWVRL